MKKWSERCKHCELAVVRWSQKFCPAADPLSRAQEGQNLISWRWSLPLPTNPVWWGSMHAISSYHGNRPTQTHAAHPPQTGPITNLQYTAPLSLACSVTTVIVRTCSLRSCQHRCSNTDMNNTVKMPLKALIVITMCSGKEFQTLINPVSKNISSHRQFAVLLQSHVLNWMRAMNPEL